MNSITLVLSMLILRYNNYKYFSGVAKTSGTSSGGWPQVKIKTPSVSAVSNPINPTNSVASVVVKTDSVTDVGAGVIQPQVFDMPIDPNEPTYCLCKEVSYGQMIGCDNPDVSI